MQPDMVIDTGRYRLEISNSANPQVLTEILKAISHVE
jgi:hypothetical protein